MTPQRFFMLLVFLAVGFPCFIGIIGELFSGSGASFQLTMLGIGLLSFISVPPKYSKAYLGLIGISILIGVSSAMITPPTSVERLVTEKASADIRNNPYSFRPSVVPIYVPVPVYTNTGGYSGSSRSYGSGGYSYGK